MLACTESNFSNFKFEYLRENKFLRKTILACLSGAQMGLIHEKNRGRKSRDTAPLSHLPYFPSKIRFLWSNSFSSVQILRRPFYSWFSLFIYSFEGREKIIQLSFMVLIGKKLQFLSLILFIKITLPTCIHIVVYIQEKLHYLSLA